MQSETAKSDISMGRHGSGHTRRVAHSSNKKTSGMAQVQRSVNAPGYGQAMNRAQMMFPPLGETSFSEQYKTFKALGGKKHPL